MIVQKVFDTVPGSTLQRLRNCHLPCFGPQLPAKTIKILPFSTIYLHVAGFYHLLNQHVCQETECKNRHENPIFLCVKPDIKEI